MAGNEIGNGLRTGTDKKCNGTLFYEVMSRGKTFVIIDK